MSPQNCFEESEESVGPLGARSPIPAALQCAPEDAAFVCRVYLHAHDALDAAEFRSLFSPVLEDLVWTARRATLASSESSRGFQKAVQVSPFTRKSLPYLAYIPKNLIRDTQ